MELSLEKILVSGLLLFPLLGFIFNGLRFRSSCVKTAGLVSSMAVFLSFVSGLLLFFLTPVKESFQVFLFDWVDVGGFLSRISFLLDPISILMVLVITGVGTLIHIFSIGYMSEDPRPAKYFAYLNLFVFNMLILVLGDNLLLMFVGWEGVGFCSYLLIGFWFTDLQKAKAGLKAFITNRIGDAGLLLGLFFTFQAFHTIDFLQIAEGVPQTPINQWFDPLTLACLFLFIGAVGKSAQIPLYIWLPDAMAGPTPVSALIHAATMVTAGVYMILRLNVLFMAAPLVMTTIAIIGSLTAFFAATIALTQWDIKKVLAYSTVSQLGYMFMALGVGAFSSGLFHLITHAFFKALLFLGAGSVIHSLQGEQDLSKMGGLKKFMPWTHATFLVGWLAIIGVPPLSGFFSKDEILWRSFSSVQGGFWIWCVGFVTALLTAFYMTRLMVLTFWKKPSSSRFEKHTPHESPKSMTWVLVALALLSAVAGIIGLPHILPGHPTHYLMEWLSLTEARYRTQSVAIEWSLMGLSTLAVISSASLAYYFYKKKPEALVKFVLKIKPVYSLVFEKYRIDELYDKFIVRPTLEISQALWRQVDQGFIDNISKSISGLSLQWSKVVRDYQDGKIESYAMYIVFCVIVFISVALMV